MADVHHVISLGIGSPADIPHFILFGLSPNPILHLPGSECWTVTVPSDSWAITVPEDSWRIPVPECED